MLSKEEGYETLIFHTTGIGGRAMGDLIRRGFIQCVLDITTTEVADYVVGRVKSIFLEYSLANSREERRNLYLVLFYYVRHQINETCEATSVSEHTNDEIQPLATLFTFAAAPEAFYISVKLGVYVVEEGVLDHRDGMKAKPS